MAGFFSLGGGGGGAGGRVSNNIHQDLHQNINPPNAIPIDAWYWYRNNDTTYQGLELFQHQAQLLQQQRQTQLQQQQDLYSTAVGLGVGSSRNAINVANGSPSRSTTMRGSRVGSSSCQDCGNQAKKDCPHMRCRTCCKARGFDCSTHVKSTWVPASKRRERQQQIAQMQKQKQRLDEQLRQEEQARGGNSKRQKENPSSSSFASGLEDGDFPEEVSFQVALRCVRVTSLDDDEDQYAYKTAVTIGGHVFKGILYDQGPDNNYTTGESSIGGGGGGSQAPAALDLIPSDPITTTSSNISATVTGGPVTAPSSSAYLDPSTLYPTPLNTFMAGTQFFPTPRSP